MAEDNIPWPLPAAWKWGTIADVAEVASNLISPSNVPAFPHIAPNHIESGRPRLLPYLTVKEDGVTSPKHRFFPGQILYSKIRPYLRKAVLVNFEGVCSADMYPLNARCDPHYLLWWLLSPGFNNLAMEHQGRTVLPKINQEALYRIPVPIPPQTEQRRIASRLNASFERSERVRRELSRIPRLVMRYKQAILAAVFRGDLTPGGTNDWPTKPLGEMAGLQLGKMLDKAKNKGTPHAYLRNVNVRWFAFNLSDTFEMPFSDSEREKFSIRDGDIMICEGGEPGRAAIWRGGDTQIKYQKALHRARVHPGYRPEWIVYQLYYAAKTEMLPQHFTGTTIKHLPQQALAEIHFLSPPEDIQIKLITVIERAFRAVDRLANEAARAMILLDRLDQATLDKAFRGELIPLEKHSSDSEARNSLTTAKRSLTAAK